MTQDFILLLSNILTGIAGWFVGRRRQQAETDNQVLKNLEVSIGIYKQIIDDLKEEIKLLNYKIQELEKKVDMLHQENSRLKANL